VLFEPKRLSSEDINEVYNIADIFMHLSGGEGFGLSYVESMLAGTPCILNDNTTSPELVGGRKSGFGKLVKLKGEAHISEFNCMYDLADEDDALVKLTEVYDDWRSGGTWLKSASARGIEFHKKWCDPERVTDQWEEVLNRIIRYNNKVLWHSFFGRGVGYTSISETIIPEMEKLGYDIHVNDWSSGSSPILEERFRKLYEKYLANRDKIDWKKYPQVVCWLMDSFETVMGEHKLGWAFCESTKVRSYYQHFCNSMEYILTSSEFNKKVQQDSGFTSDIRIVPPCVDPLLFPRLERTTDRPFTFLHIGVRQERKNPGMVLAGYVQAFPVADGRTKLILKSNDFGTLDDLKAMYAHRSDIEWIYTNDRPLSQKELLALYQRSDCYINLSHGEGIGMPDLEAMATGMPVIGTNWDTRGLFLDDSVGWMVKTAYMAPAYTQTVKDDSGLWVNLDGQDYIEKLKYVAKHPEEARRKGAVASERVHTMFTPEKAAKALDAVLMEIYDKRTSARKTSFEDERYYIDTNQYTPLYFEGAAQIIMAQLPEIRKDSVLDIGCGRGFLTLHLLRNGVRVKGIDISEYAVSHPMPGCEGALCKGDAMDLPYEDKSFDWAVSFSVLEHLPEKDVPKAIREMSRVVRKGAFLRIAIPYPQKSAAELFKEDNTHITLHPWEWWVKTLAENGMKMIATDGQYDMVVVPTEVPNNAIKPGDRVLIGVPTKDRTPYLKKLIASLRGQTFKDWDLMIVDDSCIENPNRDGELLATLDQLYVEGHLWHLIRGAGQNQAVAHNRVLACALEQGYRLVMRLDDDITLESSHLEIIYKEFLKDQKCEYAAMGGIYLDPNRPKEQQVAPPNWRLLDEFAGKLDPLWPFAQMVMYPEDVEFRDDLEHLYSSYFYRPELVEEVGGFAKDLSAVAFREETLPIATLWMKGYKLRVCVKAVGYHYNAQVGGLRSYNHDSAAPMYRSDDVAYKARIAELKKKYGR
jgi:glycosyltransferase involved in cell wall biosynthesis